MAVSVRLDKAFVENAKIQAEVANRSVAKQIEYMAKIGQIAIDNPELSFELVNESLLAKAEMDHGLVNRYQRLTKR